ncbi:MAG: transcription termination/antitermination factor NusG [Candidatus Coatesbacteria bacterium]|nr:transcription termination/antitermination factor NusG [Candidatus Coatesbacteria bacterium]
MNENYSNSEDNYQNEAEEEIKISDNPNLDWYAVQVYTANEEKVKSLIDLAIKQKVCKDLITNVIIPQAEISTIKLGKKQTVNKKKYPGYVFVQMELNIDTWHYIKGISGVIGFIGEDTKRAAKSLSTIQLADIKRRVVPLTKEEVEGLTRGKKEEKGKESKPDFTFEEGNVVEIIDGPFADFKGQIAEVNKSKGKVKVIVNIFGRPTPVELDYVQIRQI